MSRRPLHPLSLFACTASAAAMFLLTGMRAAGGVLTPEQFELLQHMSLEKLPDGQGGNRLTIRFTGVNVQIVNGLAATSTLNGTGNLIVGYDEPPFLDPNRTGSHNLVVGNAHNYTSYGGAVLGQVNTTSAPFAAVTGGQFNQATALCAAVSGGSSNRALNDFAAVSGGILNTASGASSSVSGGRTNIAEGEDSSILGGESNYCGARWATVAGGSANLANGEASSISGSCFLVNSGDCSVIP